MNASWDGTSRWVSEKAQEFIASLQVDPAMLPIQKNDLYNIIRNRMRIKHPFPGMALTVRKSSFWNDFWRGLYSSDRKIPGFAFEGTFRVAAATASFFVCIPKGAVIIEVSPVEDNWGEGH